MGKSCKTEVRLSGKDVAKEEIRMYNMMRQTHIKQIISLIQRHIGDFQAEGWKPIYRFIYSSQLVFTVVTVFLQLPLKFYNENNAWRRDAGKLLGFVMLLTSSGTWDKSLLLANSTSLNWVKYKKGGWCYLNTIEGYCVRSFSSILSYNTEGHWEMEVIYLRMRKQKFSK